MTIKSVRLAILPSWFVVLLVCAGCATVPVFTLSYSPDPTVSYPESARRPVHIRKVIDSRRYATNIFFFQHYSGNAAAVSTSVAQIVLEALKSEYRAAGSSIKETPSGDALIVDCEIQQFEATFHQAPMIPSMLQLSVALRFQTWDGDGTSHETRRDAHVTRKLGYGATLRLPQHSAVIREWGNELVNRTLHKAIVEELLRNQLLYAPPTKNNV